MTEDNTPTDGANQTGLVKINLFTTELEPLGEYHAATAPRVGDDFVWDDDLYHVELVIWEGEPDSIEAQVRLGQ